MPNKKKKQQITGFTVYMKEIMPQLKANGVLPANAGLAQCVPVAHPRWKNLPPPEREKFERKAREEKARAGSGGSAAGVRPDRLDNTGQLISQRVDKEAELAKKRTRESRFHEVRWPIDTEKLLEYDFYIVAFEYLCRTEESEFLPVEVAMVEFSLLEGIKRKFHQFVKHGPIPLGYRFECQQRSDDTHQIPIDFEEANDDYMSIWLQMQNFVNWQGSKDEYPPIYCLGSDRECVEYCMEWIHAQSTYYGYEKNKLEKIFELENMVSNLYARGENESLSRPSRTSIIESLCTSAWDYEYGTRCDWHEEKEVKDCALGKCQRFVYAISDTSSNLWSSIQLKPGKHLPVRDSNPPFQVIEPSMVDMGKPKSSRGRGEGSRGPRFNGATPFGGGFGGGFGGRDFRFRDSSQDEELSRSQFDDMSESDASSFQSTMRRPHLPDSSTQSEQIKKAPWATANARSHNELPRVNDDQEFPSLGASPQPFTSGIFNDEDFPSMGRGGPKFAGRREPPPASHAPSPPTSWNKPQRRIHDEVRRMEEEEERRSAQERFSPNTTDHFSDSSSASSHGISTRKLTLQEAVRQQEEEDLERRMREAIESQKPRLPSTTPKALQAGLVQSVGRGRGRGVLGAPKGVNVRGGIGRGLGGLGGIGRGQPKAANKPLINMGKPPSLKSQSPDSSAHSLFSSDTHPQRSVPPGPRLPPPVTKPIVEAAGVSISEWSSDSQQTASKTLDEGANGDNEDVSSTTTWESIFSDLPEIQMQSGFKGDSSDFPSLDDSMSKPKPQPFLGRGRGVLQLTNLVRPPPGFRKSAVEDKFSNLNVDD